jgi:predicted O-linked N-acetylglucosamine transferase (SPINDLY family)
MALQSDLAGVEGLRLHCKMHLCDWSDFDAACSRLTASIRADEPVSQPFVLLAIPSTVEEQLQYARSWSAHQYPAAARPIWAGERYGHERIRVAYLSGDFREHAISRLVAGLYESHDRTRFEVLALSSGPSDGSGIRRRIETAFERFVDVTSYSDDQLAEFIRASEIDLLVDVAGYTAWARTGALARRSAPVQINYLGYPGTMGASYVDYIIADAIIIPEEHKPFYSEKVVHLPHTYQPNDSKRAVPQRSFRRTELGLPADSAVLCCFNSCYKITPPVFDSWMQILKGAANSVLWLFEENAIAPSNLQREAAARGIDPQRLIFATPMPHDDHMARLQQADLFLDTAPYNAHTSASDALWIGLPLVTRIGDTFAGRVAASLLTAMGVPELVTSSVEAYEALAIELAGNPERRAAIKRKLAANRPTAPLFDTARYTRHIEAAYVAMYERWQAGLPPTDIAVPN